MFEKKELPPDKNTENVIVSNDVSVENSNMCMEQVEPAGKTKRTKVSILAQQLKDTEVHGSNPFFKYAKFDGRVSKVWM